MVNGNGATNGVAGKGNVKKDSSVLNVVAPDGKLKQEPAPEVKAETPPAEVAKLSIQELLKRNEEVNKLAKKRSALLEIYDNVTAFAVTESAPGVNCV